MAKKRAVKRKAGKKAAMKRVKPRAAKKAITRKAAKRAAKKAKLAYAGTKPSSAWEPGGREWARVLGHFGTGSR